MKNTKDNHTNNNPENTEGSTAQADNALKPAPASQSRRKFLGNVGGAAAVTIAAGAVNIPALGGAVRSETTNLEIVAGGGAGRAQQAYDIRVQAATFQKITPLPDHTNNGDEERYLNRIGNYSKGMPHNALGEVDQVAYNSFLRAIETGNPDDFERIPMGDNQVQFKNPQGGLAFEMQGADPGHMYQPPPPTFSSPEIAAEIAENYWMALARDINFSDYDSHPLIAAATADLNKFSDFRGPRYRPSFLTRGQTNLAAERAVANNEFASAESEQPDQPRVPIRQQASPGVVTAGTLFRGLTPGDLTGPYISQFLWKDFKYGVQSVSQKMRTTIPGDDYLTSYSDWLYAQNARGQANLPNRYDQTPRYIRNGRDLGEWVHLDYLYQAYFNAMSVLLTLGAPTDSNNPYNKYRNQCGFGTFGNPHLQALVTSVATNALRAVWFQKWYVHRRLRPEAFSGRVHNHLTKATTYPINNEILNSAAVQEVYRKYGSYLLPIAFVEGCPSHPAYGAGHATVAGACTTVLKWWFDESWVIPNPVVASPDGLSVVDYRGSENLTVGNELNKVASNVALGRNMAGVHWRSDATESLKLGEAIAISILQDQKHCYNERYDGLSLTKFDGSRITI
ncbi:MAG TPA: vanadium-dependent haloperoxidase [Blastocatellia bacterium]|nr:vanadium-dependent haloperoxidase [Blastocatellia bacterium]